MGASVSCNCLRAKTQKGVLNKQQNKNQSLIVQIYPSQTPGIEHAKQDQNKNNYQKECSNNYDQSYNQLIQEKSSIQNDKMKLGSAKNNQSDATDSHIRLLESDGFVKPKKPQNFGKVLPDINTRDHTIQSKIVKADNANNLSELIMKTEELQQTQQSDDDSISQLQNNDKSYCKIQNFKIKRVVQEIQIPSNSGSQFQPIYFHFDETEIESKQSIHYYFKKFYNNLKLETENQSQSIVKEVAYSDLDQKQFKNAYTLSQKYIDLNLKQELFSEEIMKLRQTSNQFNEDLQIEYNIKTLLQYTVLSHELDVIQVQRFENIALLVALKIHLLELKELNINDPNIQLCLNYIKSKSKPNLQHFYHGGILVQKQRKQFLGSQPNQTSGNENGFFNQESNLLDKNTEKQISYKSIRKNHKMLYELSKQSSKLNLPLSCIINLYGTIYECYAFPDFIIQDSNDHTNLIKEQNIIKQNLTSVLKKINPYTDKINLNGINIPLVARGEQRNLWVIGLENIESNIQNQEYENQHRRNLMNFERIIRSRQITISSHFELKQLMKAHNIKSKDLRPLNQFLLLEIIAICLKRYIREKIQGIQKTEFTIPSQKSLIELFAKLVNDLVLINFNYETYKEKQTEVTQQNINSINRILKKQEKNEDSKMSITEIPENYKHLFGQNHVQFRIKILLRLLEIMKIELKEDFNIDKLVIRQGDYQYRLESAHIKCIPYQSFKQSHQVNPGLSLVYSRLLKFKEYKFAFDYIMALPLEILIKDSNNNLNMISSIITLAMEQWSDAIINREIKKDSECKKEFTWNLYKKFPFKADFQDILNQLCFSYESLNQNFNPLYYKLLMYRAYMYDNKKSVLMINHSVSTLKSYLPEDDDFLYKIIAIQANYYAQSQDFKFAFDIVLELLQLCSNKHGVDHLFTKAIFEGVAQPIIKQYDEKLFSLNLTELLQIKTQKIQVNLDLQE